MFDKHWGKTTIYGIEVYVSKSRYWDSDNSPKLRQDAGWKRFLNTIGASFKSLEKVKYKGVDYAYFGLNLKKYGYTASDSEDIALAINNSFNINDIFELECHYDGASGKIVPNAWILKSGADPELPSSYTIDTYAIITELLSDTMRYFANTGLVSAGADYIDAIPNKKYDILRTKANVKPSSAPLTRIEYASTQSPNCVFALVDNGSVFQQQGLPYSVTTSISQDSNGLMYYKVSFKLKYKVVADASASSYIVNRLHSISTAIETSSGYRGTDVYSRANHVMDTRIKEAVLEIRSDGITPMQVGKNLRVDYAHAMKKSDFAELFQKCIYTDYKEKEKDGGFFADLVAVIIVVVAIVVAFWCPACSAAFGGGMLGSLAATAAFLTISTLVYSLAFPTAIDNIRILGKFAQVVGLMSMVAGIWSSIQNSFNTMAQTAGTKASQEAAQQGASEAAQRAIAEKTISEYGIGQYIKDLFVNTMTDIATQVKDMFSFDNIASKFSTENLGSITMRDVGGWLDNLNTAMKMYMKFFGEKIEQWKATDEQSTKEDGVEAYYGAVAMLDEVDALVKMDYMIKGNSGGEITERFMTKLK